MFRLYIRNVLDICNGGLINIDFNPLIRKAFPIIKILNIIGYLNRHKDFMIKLRSNKNSLTKKDEDELREFYYKIGKMDWDGIYVEVEKFLSENKSSIPNYNLFKDEYRTIIIGNLSLLHYLKNIKIEDLKHEILFFIHFRLFFRTDAYQVRSFVVDKYQHLCYKLPTYFLALRLFYSEETKHLFSKEMLEEMRDYEKRIKEFIRNDSWRNRILPMRRRFSHEYTITIDEESDKKSERI